jgi:hypothetical protein
LLSPWSALLNGEFFVMNADGTEETQLTNNEFDDSDPAWSPDGTRIAFEGRREGGFVDEPPAWGRDALGGGGGDDGDDGDDDGEDGEDGEDDGDDWDDEDDEDDEDDDEDDDDDDNDGDDDATDVDGDNDGIERSIARVPLRR